jgi:hypothetical protein
MTHWRVSRDELARLLGVSPAAPQENSTTTSSAGGPAAPVPASTADATSQRKGPLTPLHFQLARALPRLWRFAQAQPEATDPRALRRKLRELMSWVLTKEGYSVQPNHPAPYVLKGEAINGRLELLVCSAKGTPCLAIETDWLGEPSSLLKLETLHAQNVPGLWIIGRACAATELASFRVLANRTLRRPTGGWLAIYHLDHGWVRSPHTSRPTLLTK